MTEFEQLQIEQLKRIADVLEDINGTLIDMSTPVEQLAECVGVHPARYGGLPADRRERRRGSIKK